MSRPFLKSRIKQSDDFVADRINATEIRAFVQIASVTTPAQILHTFVTTVLLGNDVLDMKQ